MARLLPDDYQGRVALGEGEDLKRYTVQLSVVFGCVIHVQLGRGQEALGFATHSPIPGLLNS